jgi:hypothetical protein
LQIVTADLHFRTAPATTALVGSGNGNNVLKDHSQPLLLDFVVFGACAGVKKAFTVSLPRAHGG